jgi:hypothetical protein
LGSLILLPHLLIEPLLLLPLKFLVFILHSPSSARARWHLSNYILLIGKQGLIGILEIFESLFGRLLADLALVGIRVILLSQSVILPLDYLG